MLGSLPRARGWTRDVRLDEPASPSLFRARAGGPWDKMPKQMPPIVSSARARVNLVRHIGYHAIRALPRARVNGVGSFGSVVSFRARAGGPMIYNVDPTQTPALPRPRGWNPFRIR